MPFVVLDAVDGGENKLQLTYVGIEAFWHGCAIHYYERQCHIAVPCAFVAVKVKVEAIFDLKDLHSRIFPDALQGLDKPPERVKGNRRSNQVEETARISGVTSK